MVEFVGLASMDLKYGISRNTQWPAFRSGHHFWSDAAQHIKFSTSSSVILNSE